MCLYCFRGLVRTMQIRRHAYSMCSSRYSTCRFWFYMQLNCLARVWLILIISMWRQWHWRSTCCQRFSWITSSLSLSSLCASQHSTSGLWKMSVEGYWLGCGCGTRLMTSASVEKFECLDGEVCICLLVVLVSILVQVGTPKLNCDFIAVSG